MKLQLRTSTHWRTFPVKVVVRLLFSAFLGVVFVYSYQTGRPGSILVAVIDSETGKPTPARVLVNDSRGQPVSAAKGALAVPGSVLGIPEEAVAVMYGRQDRAEGFAVQPDGSFYVDGSFSMQLPAGRYTVRVSKGYEYRPSVESLEVVPEQDLTRRIELDRWINMPERGWYSADDHIHLRRSPREDPLILKWTAAEDVHVANLLQMGDFWATFYSQYGFGEEGRSREGEYILSPGQEDPRTPEIGHTISLGSNEYVRFPREYYLYDKVFDEVRRLGGVSGYAHQGMSFHGYRGMTLDVTQEKLDFLELLQFCVEGGPLHLEHYYTFLDLGFRLTATAGSDFPWCGRGPRFGLEEGCSQIGDARFFTRVEGPLSFESWLDGVKKGRTFVSSGPMLDFRVGDALPGDTVNMDPGTRLKIRVTAFGEKEQIPLTSLEIVGHGEVLKSVRAVTESDTEKLELELDWTAEKGIWLAARAAAGIAQLAHTTPVYVTVAGGGFHNPRTALRNLELLESYLVEIEQALENPEPGLDRQMRSNEAALRERISRVRGDLARLREKIIPGS